MTVGGPAAQSCPLPKPCPACRHRPPSPRRAAASCNGRSTRGGRRKHDRQRRTSSAADTASVAVSGVARAVAGTRPRPRAA
jgi:hypothetical protein